MVEAKLSKILNLSKSIFSASEGNALMGQSEESSRSLFRWVGYGLLTLAVLDIINILVPPQLTNPTWEFQTVGALVERVPVPLLALVLIFYEGANLRGKVEKTILKVLSWASLLIGVFYLLLIPLAVSNTLRINNQNNAQVLAQSNQRLSQIQQIKGQLNNATPQELNNLLSRLSSQGRAPNIENSGELKNQLASEIARAEKSLKTQSEAARANARLALLKNSAKWNLGALISGALFIHIWRATRWTRHKPRGQRTQSTVSSS